MPALARATGDRAVADSRRTAAAHVEEALHWLPDDEPALGGPAPSGGATGAMILIADDNADMRAHLRRTLSPYWSVRLASDGDTALRMARTDPPDIVLTDAMMPVLDGFGLIQALRSDPATRELPIIMLSARAGQESTVEGLEAGADDYLVKPFTAAELVARVRTHLETARIRQLAAERMRSLANASHALSTTLDIGQLVEVLTTLVVPQWADECVVWLREKVRGSGEWRAVPWSGAGRGGSLVAEAHADPEDFARAVGVSRALSHGRPRQATLRDRKPVLTLPLTARGRRVGALTVARRRAAPWRPTDLEYLTDLGHRLALALDNAARYQAERNVAVTLQRSLLPSELPRLPGVDLAARYLPGGQGTSVGGDWYDAFPLPPVPGRPGPADGAGGGIALAIGDVMGRGVRAAAIMGQLRAALRGYALEGLAPAQLLTRLDAFVEASGEPHLSTCLYAVYHPEERRLRIAGAGHLPPLLVTPDGRCEHLQFPVGLPLGVGVMDDITYVDHETLLEPGSMLLLYTDGLIETRQQGIDEGMTSLERATGRLFRDAEAACDHVLQTLGGTGDSDDTTLLAVVVR
jgi:serine phosphatase RsbU (regulator of sigma subunit)/CheY-like chemotaxis protein